MVLLFGATNTNTLAGKAPGGARAGRIGAAEHRRLLAGARTHASRVARSAMDD
jgi:hypothetical protein